MTTRFILAALLALAGPFGGSPWDKPPEKWNEADVSRILQDSPWSPATVKLQHEISSHQTDPQTRLQTDAPPNSDNANQIPGIQLSRTKPQPKVPVIWWSSKTVRLAQLRLLQLRNPQAPAASLSAEELPDYVLVIQGTEPLRIIQDATEDLRDTAFLELSNGTTLDLESVLFSNGSPLEAPHVEFHFPRQLDNRPTLDLDSDRVVFHCKAAAKTPRLDRDNSITVRAEFRPRAMRVHGVPDL
ncbi:MAG: hypothetical protein ABSG69_14900 [Candidatus Acidiferrum sp.]|jgi:hypothetical protein